MIFQILWILIYNFFQDCKKSFILILENKFVYKEKNLIYLEYKKSKIPFFLLQNNICEFHNTHPQIQEIILQSNSLINGSFEYFLYKKICLSFVITNSINIYIRLKLKH